MLKCVYKLLSGVVLTLVLPSLAPANTEYPVVVLDGITSETIADFQVTVETDRSHFYEPAEAAQVTFEAEGYLPRTLFLKMQDDDTILFRPVTLYAGSSRDSDGDGLPDVQERVIGTNPYDADTDGDSLPDGTEVNGYDYIDYPGMGADPRQRTVFVEVDYMRGYRPYTKAFDIVRAAFAAQGIDLIVHLDDEVPVDANLNPVRTEFQAYKRRYFSSRRNHGFHYALFGNRYNGGNSSGISLGIVSSDFLVTLGMSGGGSVESQAGTFMHELGHNLGLRHGGSDNIHRKPNYLSIMNYSFQFKGVPHVRGNRFDYSRSRLPALNESDLNEFAGIRCDEGYGTIMRTAGGVDRFFRDASSRIDWNRSGRLVSNLSTSINGDSQRNVLTGFDDWASINFSRRRPDFEHIGDGPGFTLRRIEVPTLPGDDEECPSELGELP